VVVFLSIIAAFFYIKECIMRYNAVVKGGLHANYSGNLDSIKLSWNDFNSTRAVQSLSKKGSYALREILDSILDNGVGANARFRYSEIAPSQELGGKRTINENSYLVDRNTTAGDVANLKIALTEHSELTHAVDQQANGDHNPLGTR
jgi:hypothetical protein